MRSLTRAKIVPLLAAGALVALAACGGGGGGTPQASQSAAQGPVPEPTEPVTITFSSWVGNEKGMKALYKKFQAEHPNIKIVDTQYGAGDPLKTADLTKTIIQAHPNLKGIFAANEGSAIGVLNAVKETGKQGKVTVIGYDAGKQQKDAVRSGVEAGAITQDPVGIGSKCVEAAVKAIKGETVEKNIDTGFHWYDKANVDSAELKPLLYD